MSCLGGWQWIKSNTVITSECVRHPFLLLLLLFPYSYTLPLIPIPILPILPIVPPPPYPPSLFHDIITTQSTYPPLHTSHYNKSKSGKKYTAIKNHYRGTPGESCTNYLHWKHRCTLIVITWAVMKRGEGGVWKMGWGKG